MEEQPSPRVSLKILAIYVSLGFVVLASGGIAWAAMSVEPPKQLWVAAPETKAPLPAPAPQAQVAKTISLSAVGDIIMGDAPQSMPANDGKGFFDNVKHLFPADLVMGNMEEPITDDTGHVKCSPEQTRCNQFRVPPSYAQHLKDAGFHLLNQANNHGYDYGPKGYANTQKALEAVGLKHTGAKGQITLVDVQGIKVAVLGFSSYPRDNSLIDIAAAKAVVQKAAALATVVVIQVHWGAEGADQTHVKPGTEMFLGENRGDPIAFSHAVIDAGADLIIGHGPHTLRAMEVYKGRLIAYSLGNFAGGKGLKGEGNLGWGGVLKATVNSEGALVAGHFASTYYNTHPGVPMPDPQNRGLNLMRDLSKQDFPSSGARFSVSGEISTL
ncbi:MAG TPA: capsular biosynthesis protein [Micromonosporaceae bacterium]|nr:capsular biosynthesis protein [Micromonosporaceae bacterium]